MSNIKIADNADFFENFLITHEMINDLVLFYYNGTADSIEIILERNNNNETLRGKIDNDRLNNKFIVTVFIETIRKHFNKQLRIGGNFPHDNLSIAILSVIIHEVQHANQSLIFPLGTAFWSGDYYMKPCEVDARRFVDNNINNIREIVGYPHVVYNKSYSYEADAIYTIADIFSELDEVSIDDIKSELNNYNLNNPFRVKELVDILTINNTNVVKDYYDS